MREWKTKTVLKMVGWVDLRGLGGACLVPNVSSKLLNNIFPITLDTCTKQATKPQLVGFTRNNGAGNLSSIN